MAPRFYCSTCQVGAEKAVKAEVLAEFPDFHWAFSRPGFVTFKEGEGEEPPLQLRHGIFTRLWAEVLGQAKDLEALKALAGLIPEASVLQAFDRDEALPGEEPQGFSRHSHIKAILETLPGLAGRALGSRAKPSVGAEVYSLVWVDDFHVFLTRHIHSTSLSGLAGNIVDLVLPEDSPSRSYLKIEEALQRFKPRMRKGMQVLELGCAPGGATLAMLKRGLEVTGVDPQHMAPVVSAQGGFRAVRKQARYLQAGDLEDCNPEWLVMDMSIPPADALAELAHVVIVLKSSLGGELRLGQGFFTLKLNDWKFASQISHYLERLEKLGFRSLHAIQLCANRQEFFVWAEGFE